MLEALPKKRKILYFLMGFLVVASVVFSESLRKMVSRRQEINRAAKELQDVSIQVNQMREKIARLRSNSIQYEHLVRNDLGYLRPGEKEVRFGKDPQ